ncbi:ester cyclase [Pseudarthrobacter sp. N5]|uniref:ester cyclase n=1 Tax=Pseudarthrobacter sp. N5 TaxID=3418416 RepID=UPI003CF98A36
MRSRDQVREYMETWFTAFSDMRSKTTNRVVSEDQAAAEIEFTGTNTGPLLMGGQEIPATGRAVTGTGTYFASVRNGKIVSFRAHSDISAIMG